MFSEVLLSWSEVLRGELSAFGVDVGSLLVGESVGGVLKLVIVRVSYNGSHIRSPYFRVGHYRGDQSSPLN